jgi:hypothetical protein
LGIKYKKKDGNLVKKIFSLTKDQESYDAYIKDKKCLILEDGVQITVTDWPGLLGGKAGFNLL